MASTETTMLQLSARDPEGSRSARRMRREGRVPGVIYGGGEDPQHFSVDGRLLRNTLAHAAQVIEVAIDGASTNVLIKDVQRHPVRGEATHVDLLRVRMDVAIHSTVLVELTGGEINFAFVTSRWGSPFWRIYDLLLLVFALIHGVNGARVVIGDYIERGGFRTTLLTFLYLLTFIWLLLGIYVIVSFDPDGAPSIGPFS